MLTAYYLDKRFSLEPEMAPGRHAEIPTVRDCPIPAWAQDRWGWEEAGASIREMTAGLGQLLGGRGDGMRAVFKNLSGLANSWTL